MSKQLTIKEKLSNVLYSENIKHFGFVSLDRPLTIDFYLEWLKSDFQGSMKYLERHSDRKENPQKLLPKAQSAIVIAYDYIPHPLPLKKVNLKIARYAQGQDYHSWLQEKLNKIIRILNQNFPQDVFCAYTDSAPVLERDLAYRGGLGWFGKNTCLIDEKRGSFFLIGEIYSSLPIEAKPVMAPDRCGTCTRCIEVCPTQAIIKPRFLDARKCISYLTIESKEIPNQELREQIGDHYFGCDLCQTVCPWNKKSYKDSLHDVSFRHDEIINDLRFILSASNGQIERFFQDSPLSRTPGWGHKRNALIVIGNKKLKELYDDVYALKNHERLSELVDWTLSKLS